MLAWERRPVEMANLFNPAFCSILLREAVRAYQEEQDAGLPYILAFPILPLVLHKPTREALPRTIRTRMHVWLQDRPEIHIGFADRVRQLTGITKESIIFGVQSDLFAFDDYGDFIVSTKRFRPPLWSPDSEPANCYKSSRFLGRWLANVGDTSTILTMWGIRP